MVATVLVGMMAFLLLVLFLYVISESIRRGTKVVEKNYNNVKEIKKNTLWTKEELVIVAFYALFEKEGGNSKETIESISDGIGRSYNSILKKITLIEQILEGGVEKYNLLKDVVKSMQSLGKEGSENLLNKSIESTLIIN